MKDLINMLGDWEVEMGESKANIKVIYAIAFDGPFS
jgi:hypothetical protein